MAESLIIIWTHGYIGGTLEAMSAKEWSAVDRKGKSDAKGRARPDYIAITLYRCRLMGPPNHAKRSMANML